jgi:hypothetical protein
MVQLWRKSQSPIKESLLDEIKRDLEEGEYYSAVKEVLLTLRVPV